MTSLPAVTAATLEADPAPPPAAVPASPSAPTTARPRDSGFAPALAIRHLRHKAKASDELAQHGGANRGSIFGEEHTPREVIEMVGHGAASRVFANGMSHEQHLAAIQQFFDKGATLSHATAFATSARASKRNAEKHSPASRAASARPRDRPFRSVAEQMGAADEHPINEMAFFNIGGARCYYYYGLDMIRDKETVLCAGPHVRDTAVGVLMLDRYKIHERPGDPANPFTFWPYQAIYVVPQGITFDACKAVGSSGAAAGREFPLQTSAICQALMALAEVAARQGYQRLMITADCGYYALATEAFCQQLLCWGRQSWAPHPAGFAAFEGELSGPRG